MSASYEYYRIFYYVAKYKNFTRAANVLLTSQPSITRSIQNLEHELGCQLFIRNKHGVELTHEGVLLYEYVSVGCEQFTKGEEIITGSLSLQAGILYIGANETAIHGYLLSVLDEFHQLYPHVRVKITNTSTTEAIEELKSGMIDLAIGTTPTQVEKPLKEIKLKQYQDILVAGPKFSKLADSRFHLHELTKIPLISLTKSSRSFQFFSEFYQKYKLTMNTQFEVTTSDLIIPMVELNMGMGFISEEFAAPALARGSIIKVNLAERIPPRYICMIQDTQHPQSIASRELQKLILKNASIN